MKIKKISQAFAVIGKIFNAKSNSKQDTYSCDYINNLSRVIGCASLYNEFESYVVDTDYIIRSKGESLNSSLTVDATNGKITVNDDKIKYLLVSAQVFIQVSTATQTHITLRIYKNDNSVVVTRSPKIATQYDTTNASLPAIIIPVKKGDYIQGIFSMVGSKGSIGTNYGEKGQFLSVLAIG